MYALIGKLALKSGVFYVGHRFRRQIRVGAGLVAVVIGIAAYFASRNVPEG